MPFANSTSRIIPRTSKQAGTKHIRIAGLPTFFKSSRFSESPALARIMINAIFRSSDEIFKMEASIRFKAYGPNTIPVTNIPKSPGRCTFLQSHPIIMPSNSIHAILINIFLSPLFFLSKTLGAKKQKRSEIQTSLFVAETGFEPATPRV